MDLSVVLLSYNTRDLLEQALRTVAEASGHLLRKAELKLYACRRTLRLRPFLAKASGRTAGQAVFSSFFGSFESVLR